MSQELVELAPRNGQSPRDLPRYRQILASLMRYGYQDVVAPLHLKGIVRPLERVALGDDVPPQDRARRLRMVCEDLGPTFVKLGQVLSTRPDLLPEAYTTELAALRDDAPVPVRGGRSDPDRGIRPAPLRSLARIDPVPVASASISQVHRATLHDGRQIALKIRRPGIEKLVHADLDILKNLAQLAEPQIGLPGSSTPVALVREFERTLKRELDFNVERRMMERCRLQFAKNQTAHIPYVVAEFSTTRVLAMEFIGGVGVNDRIGLRQSGSTRRLRPSERPDPPRPKSSSMDSFMPIPIPATSASCRAASSRHSTTACSASSIRRTRERIADLLSGSALFRTPTA